ncbi:MAG: hypothetical protein U1E76_09995 [Planctomycetota bacterium]
MNRCRDRSLPWLLVILAVTAGAYLPAVRGELVYDDYRFVRDNPAIRELGNPLRFFTDPGTLCASEDRDIYRPLRTLSFAIDHALAGEATTFAHVENLLWHLATVAALYLLLGAGRWFDEGSRLLVTALYAVHPALTEAVAWISSRGDVMAGCFSLLACLVYVRRARAIAPARARASRSCCSRRSPCSPRSSR